MSQQKKLSRGAISAAAVALVDEQGLDALTMRRLGMRLGVEAMSLYRHVTNKADLLDAVHEAILGEMHIPEVDGGWRDQLRAMALAFRDVLVSHPNALSIFATRPAVTPASLAYVEKALEVVKRAPIAERDAPAVFQTLVAFIIGHCCLCYAPIEASALPGMSPDDGRTTEEELELGLELILQGIGD